MPVFRSARFDPVPPAQSARHLLIILLAFLSSTFIYAVLLFLPELGRAEPISAHPIDTILLLVSVPQVVLGYILAFVFVAPKGWHRGVGGWEHAPSMVKENDRPDTADAFLSRSSALLIAAAAIIEAVGIYGVVVRVLGFERTPALWMVAFSFLGLLFLVPRAVYVRRTYEELIALESGGGGDA